jgi:ubiquinone/menaquinone biosynthesis C-methylase UbiE
LKNLFPRSSHYDPDWVQRNSMGENVLYNLESLTEVISLKRGMRVLDLACGKAVSSVFLAKEFGVEVWAVDSAVPPTENLERIREQDCEKSVFPLKADARELPFADEYFDAVICIDSYMYFGTDDKYLAYISRFLKEDGILGIVDVSFTREIESFKDIPKFLKQDYSNYWYFVHSPEWWRRFWEKTGLIEVERAEILPQNEFLKSEYVKYYENSDEREPFAEALKADKENFINMFRLVGRRTRKDAYLQDYKEEF